MKFIKAIIMATINISFFLLNTSKQTLASIAILSGIVNKILNGNGDIRIIGSNRGVIIPIKTIKLSSFLSLNINANSMI